MAQWFIWTGSAANPWVRGTVRQEFSKRRRRQLRRHPFRVPVAFWWYSKISWFGCKKDFLGTRVPERSFHPFFPLPFNAINSYESYFWRKIVKTEKIFIDSHENYSKPLKLQPVFIRMKRQFLNADWHILSPLKFTDS